MAYRLKPGDLRLLDYATLCKMAHQLSVDIDNGEDKRAVLEKVMRAIQDQFAPLRVVK